MGGLIKPIFLIEVKPIKLTREEIMFTKLKQIIKPERFNKYMEEKELSPKQQWLRDNTPAKIQTSIPDLKYWGLI